MHQTVRELSSRSRLRINLLWEGLLIGLLAGGVMTFYRMGIQWIGSLISPLMLGASVSAVHFAAFLVVMLAMGILSGLCYRLSPLISGSGIPQVSAQLAGRLHPRWQSVLPFKFLGGLLTLGGGLTLGREGPSVQMGAAVGQGVGDILHRPATERRYMITGGAGAGLSAAFNAPISGAVFALEELHRNFSPRALICAMVAAFTANLVSGVVFGQKPVLHFDHVPHLSLQHYHYVVLIGVIAGLSGVLFNRCILWAKKIYARLKLKWMFSGLVPFAAVALACLFIPALFGSGEPMIFWAADGPDPPLQLMMLYLLKLILLMICFGSGLPGGIFFPLLVLGSLLGHAFGSALAGAGLLDPQYVLALSLVAMTGHFSAIVRAPLTGILLVSEMTGSFANMLPLGLVALVAYLVAEACRSEPIYESLREQLPLDQETAPVMAASDRVLMEFVVEDDSRAADSVIADVAWPAQFIIVAVRRGCGELTPNGGLEIKPGDYLVALFPRSSSAAVQRELDLLLKNPRD